MKFIALFALVAIARFEFVQATSLPFCKSDYFSKNVCQKFQFTGGVSCSNNPGPPYDVDFKHPAKFSNQRAYEIAVGITNVFENSQPQNDYATCTPIGDGRGYTCGSGGYTSDDGSMQEPLMIYADLLKAHNRKNPFQKYIAEINKIANGPSCSPFRGSTASLRGIGPVWTKAACTDKLFRQAQDEAARMQIDVWAMRHAAFFKVKTNLGLAIIRDTMEQHGDGGGEPLIGLERIGTLTKKQFHGKSPDEKTFIAKFLEIRRQMLCCYRPVMNGKADLTWPEAADRIADLQYLVKTNNWDLKTPVRLPNYGATIKSNFNLFTVPKECKGKGKRANLHLKRHTANSHRKHRRNGFTANSTVF